MTSGVFTLLHVDTRIRGRELGDVLPYQKMGRCVYQLGRGGDRTVGGKERKWGVVVEWWRVDGGD